MKDFVKSYGKTLLFFAAVGLVGGFMVGLYLMDTYPADIVAQIEAQGITNTLLALITAVQSSLYGAVLGAIGIVLGKKTGLWRDERTMARKPLFYAIIIAVVCGAVMILADVLFFGSYSTVIAESYATKPTIPYLIGTVTYGAVIEEVMLRLFCMTLIAFVLWKVFARGSERPSTAVLAAANILAALLFAAAHLPTTLLTIGGTPMILFRCFLLNGGIGLTFGWLYRRYGLRYAMLAHGGCHVVSKLIWILFL